MVKCLRCGAETVDGEVYMRIPVPTNPMMGGIMPVPSISMGGVTPREEEGLMWKEKTGEKKGFLFKSDEVRTMTIRGRRCTGCGVIEMFVRDRVE